MTGRINFTPQAERQLNELHDWITKAASPDIARRFVAAILDHIDGILVFPLASRACDDVRPGMRTSTFKKRTLVAYEVDESSGELVVNILGVFHGGRTGRPRSARTKETQSRADDPPSAGLTVAAAAAL
ncbi:MAG: type II toxin-antitoxin system RelE/ParE family toxin, partial [Actinomycetota bacterium]